MKIMLTAAIVIASVSIPLAFAFKKIKATRIETPNSHVIKWEMYDDPNRTVLPFIETTDEYTLIGVEIYIK